MAEVKNRHEIICEMGASFIAQVKYGFIPVHIMDWKVIYEFYLECRSKHKKTESIMLACDRFDLCQTTGFQIVKWMETNF